VSDGVQYEVSGGVARVLLNRPDALNALTTTMKEALREALDRAASDRDVRAVLLTGAGRAFCVGQDLREHAEALASGGAAALDTVRRHYNPIVTCITTMAKPVVAAVNGVAAGAGASFAFACDFRIAAESARFQMAFARIGLTADSGASWTLPRLVGAARATELLMLADPVDAKQALDLGLVNQVVGDSELGERARGFAEKLAAGPTLAYAAIKEALSYGAGHSLPETLEVEAGLQARCGATGDHRSATESFVAKRQVQFQGR
jgi:2-(1,2-epoxy-1,2-dihydrophenyl)acetyl-CoA isomerase